MKVEFRIDPKRFTMGDHIALEEAENMTYRQMRDLLAGHMIDEAGEFIEFEAACQIINKITDGQIQEAGAAFMKAIQEMKNNLVPPVSGGG